MTATSAVTFRVLNRPIFLVSLAFAMLGFLLPIYGKQLGASALEISGLYSIFSLMTVVGRPLVGWALDRFGRKRFLVAALAGYAGAMGVFALSHDMVTLYAARLVQGIASSLMWISAYTIATDLASAEDRGRAVGSVDEVSARGSLYGAIAGFTIVGFLTLNPGWGVMFAAYAVMAVVGAWLAWRNVPETRQAQSVQTPISSRQMDTHRLARLMIVVFATGISTTMIGPLILIFLQDRFTTDVRVLAMASIPAALVYSYLPSHLGRLSDRFGRAPLMAMGLVGSGLISLLLPGLPALGWLVVVWMAEAVGFAAAAPAQEALVADITGHETRGTGYGLYTFASSLGATLGPLAGGWLYDNVGHAAPFYLNGSVLLLSAVWVLLFLGGKRRHA